MLKYIFLVVIILLICLVVYGLINDNKRQEKYVVQTKENNIYKNINKKATGRKQEDIMWRFVEAKFHQDYMDVSTSFNNLTPNQRQIFNINNYPAKITVDKEISKKDIKELNKILEEFIDTLNEDIKKNVNLYRVSTTGWNEVIPENVPESGFAKQMKRLGLQPDLYNKPKLKTHVRLDNFSNITKYETDDEIRFVCKVVLAKDEVNDQLVIKISIVIPKGTEGSHLILEEISILGYLTSQGYGVDRIEGDDFYWFDNLEENNMISGETVINELMKKYNEREKDMQESIENLWKDDGEKYYSTPPQTAYQSYKMTETIIDDMQGKNKFGSMK